MTTSQRVHPWDNTMLPPKVIQGQSVRDYAYQWISGCCPIHQWCSGGKGIDRDVISYVKEEIVKARNWGGHEEKDVQGLIELLQYLIHNEGAEAEIYVPDQWANSAVVLLKEILEDVATGFLKDKDGDVMPRTLAEINNGFCADFATMVWERMREVRIVSDDDMMPDQEYSHTFIEFEDLYYDAECWDGVEDWTMLPTFQR